MKRLRFLPLAAILLLFAGCGVETGPTDSTSQTDETMTTKASKEIILVDRDGIKITYTGINLQNYLEGQPEAIMLSVALTVENSSEHNITVLPKDSSVNGVMKLAASGIPLDVLSGKKRISTFFFTNLEGTGITSADQLDKVEEIEFRLSVVKTENLEELFTTDLIKINP